jgi:multiple sugar transport system substrate-binding protein
MYDPLYNRLGEVEKREGTKVETVVPTHDLNERIEEEFGSGRASYDLISTHTKYAPSQRRWLTPLDEDLELSEIENFTPRTLELATHTIPDELWPELDSLVQFPLLATIDAESGSRRS